MRRSFLRIGVLLLLCAAPRLSAQQTSTVGVAVINEQECDANSPAFQTLSAGSNPVAEMQLSKCVSISDLPPIADQRWVVAASGKLTFRFIIMLDEEGRGSGPFDGTTLHAKFKVTVHVRGPNGQSASNSGEAVLFGSAAPDAPAGAVADYSQASPGGAAITFLDIPVNIDWAESSVTFTLETTQGIGTTEPNSESCTTPALRRSGLMCSFPDWDNQATMTGPDLSTVSAGLTLPAAISNDEFALFVSPAAKFQLPVMPVAIVYAPLGNGQAMSSYQVSTMTGTSAQIGNATSTTTSWIADDKTTYSGGLTISDITKKYGSGSVTLSGTWDNTVENDNQSSYGMTGQIINSYQISTTFKVPATTTKPLTELNYSTQPFWGDLIIAVLNAQFAIWDYPGGPLIQPLGSLTTIPIPLSQLVACIGSPGAAPTLTPNTSNQSHYLAYAATPAQRRTLYVWLSSQDCSDIASLDQFYVTGTQSSAPLAWRRLYGGSADTASPLTVSSSQSTQLVSTQTSGAQYTTKVSAAQTTILGASATATYLGEYVAVSGTGSGSWSTTGTQVHTTVLTYSALNSANLQSQTQASTTIQDSSGISVPINVLQDSIFQGIAVQDTDMHYLKKTKQHPPCCIRLLKKDSKLPLVKWHDFHAKGRKDPAYVLQSPYGDIIVQNPSNPNAVADQLQNLRSDAIRRHIAKPVPGPPPPSVVVPKPEEVLPMLKSFKSPSPQILNAIKMLEQKVVR